MQRPIKASKKFQVTPSETTRTNNPTTTASGTKKTNSEYLLNNVAKSLFERGMSWVFCPEIAKATEQLYPYLGFNETTALACKMLGTSILLGVLVPIQQEALRLFIDIALKNPYAFNLYRYPLLIFMGTKSLIPFIHAKNAVSCKALREKLSYMMRNDGSDWFKSKAFIAFSETNIEIINPADNITNKLDSWCHSLINLSNDRISILSHFIGALYSLYLISGFFEIALLGITINIPYLILVSLSYGYICNLFASRANDPVKQNIREKSVATDKFNKQVINSLSDFESVALIGGENFETHAYTKKLNDIYAIDLASLDPQGRLSFNNKILWEYSEVLGLIAQLLTGNLNPADALNSGKNFTHVANQAGFWNSRLDAVKGLEQGTKTIQDTRQAINQVKELVKNCKITYTHYEETLHNGVSINLEIPTKNESGFIKINKSLKPKGTYRIKGRNGAGKTTLLELIKGGINPTLGSGSIKLPSNHLFLPNKPYILKGNSYSLMQTILYPSVEEATEDQIALTKQLLNALQFQEVINELTTVGIKDWDQGQSSEQKQSRRKRGQNSEQKQNRGLSSGQKQKIAIIRCILKKPDAVFLDEPFAQMDANSRKIAINLLHKHLPNATILYIEHKHNDSSLNSDELQIVEEAF